MIWLQLRWQVSLYPTHWTFKICLFYLLFYYHFLMQLQAEAKETKDQVTLFMIIAVLQTNLCVMFVSVFGISWSEFKFVFLVTGGRGYNGQMQPGVFHGYPLKSPKVQGVTLSCCVIQTLHSSTDIWCVHGYHSNVFCGGFTDVCLWAEKGFLMTTKNRTLLPLPSARRD